MFNFLEISQRFADISKAVPEGKKEKLVFLDQLFELLMELNRQFRDGSIKGKVEIFIKLLKIFYSKKISHEKTEHSVNGHGDLILETIEQLIEKSFEMFRTKYFCWHEIVETYGEWLKDPAFVRKLFDKREVDEKISQSIASKIESLSIQMKKMEQLKHVELDESIRQAQCGASTIISQLISHQNWPFSESVEFLKPKINGISIFTEGQIEKFKEHGFKNIESAFATLRTMTQWPIGHRAWGNSIAEKEVQFSQMQILIGLFQRLINGTLTKEDNGVCILVTQHRTPIRFFEIDPEEKSQNEVVHVIRRSFSTGNL